MGDAAAIKRMAELLKSGARMLNEVCPTCKVPLFRLRSGEVTCPSCGQRYMIVGSDEEELRAYEEIAISRASRVATAKLMEVSEMLEKVSDPGEIQDLARTMLGLIEVIRSARAIRGSAG